jgi:hypothetical protein
MPSESEYERHGGICPCGVELSVPYSNHPDTPARFARHTRRVTTVEVQAIRRDPERRRHFSDPDLEEMERTGYCPFDRGNRG